MAKGLLLLLLCAPAGFTLQAANVSVLVVETGMPEDAPVSTFSGLWESGLLDVFFEEEHIVSNAPVLRLAQKPAGAFPPADWEEVAAALEWGADYFILALLDYSSADSAVSRRPSGVCLRLFKLQPYTMLYEREYPGTDFRDRDLGEEYKKLKKVIGEMAPLVKKQ